VWPLKLAIIIFFGAFTAQAEYEYYKQGLIGEYYEYDVEGSPRMRSFRNKKHVVGHVVKKPFKASWKASKYSYAGVKRGSRLLERYLKGSAHDEHEQQKLARALTEWETALAMSTEHKKSKSPQGLLYVPCESWRLFKYSLYLAGFALPRALAKGAKNIVYNTCSVGSN
jgi:hypothetical protein